MGWWSASIWYRRPKKVNKEEGKITCVKHNMTASTGHNKWSWNVLVWHKLHTLNTSSCFNHPGFSWLTKMKQLICVESLNSHILNYGTLWRNSWSCNCKQQAYTSGLNIFFYFQASFSVDLHHFPFCCTLRSLFEHPITTWSSTDHSPATM